ncbi:MAG: tripartite tricarboxylate transporter substrate binding protein [Betaproteobacteria bacterium]|nr:tripartite tricarboxylate transporter substrate binding protein [Betaproteobacteria bacterium]
MKTIATWWCAVGLVAAAPLAYAQEWPTRPVRIVVGFSPGSATDFTARTIGPKLSEIWKHPVVYENRSGAGGSLAFAMVAKATPDGHTLALISSSLVATTIISSASYDAIKDFTHVAQVGYSTSVVTTSASLNIRSLKELIAAAQAGGGKFLYGTTGAGSGTHMANVRFNMSANIKPQHVAFKGQGELLVEIVTGRVHFGIPGLGPAMGMIKEGKLVPLAVVTPNRSPQLPDVPTVNEILPHFERDATHGLVAPAGIPRAVAEKISRDLARVLELSDVRKTFDAISFTPAHIPPDEYHKMIVRLQANYERVAREAGLKR